MKKLLFSLLAVGVTSALAIGATRAYFTDTESVLGNTISTGTIDITNTSDSWMVHVMYPNAANVNLNGPFKPGDSFKQWVKITNAGNLNIGSLKASIVNATGDTMLLDNMGVALYGQVNGYDQGIYTANWGVGQIASTLQNAEVLASPVYVNPGQTAAAILKPGETETIQLVFYIPTTWDNTFQGKNVSFDVKFDAEQVH